MKKGFTLIELLIVIAIIGILAVAFLPTLLSAPAKARDTQRIAMMKKINDFILYHYSISTGGFSFPPGWYCIKTPPPIQAGNLNEFINSNLADFGGVFPQDSSANWDALHGNEAASWCRGGFGFNRPSLTSFALFDRMERPQDANSCLTGSISLTSPCPSNRYFFTIVNSM